MNCSKKSGAIIFYDVCNAFATLLRRIVFDYDLGDEHWLKSFSSAGFSQDDISHIHEFIKSNLYESGNIGNPDFDVNCLISNLTQEWYTNTWTSQEFIPNVTRTTLGSSAGIPLADLMYSLAMSRVLKTMRQSLDREGLGTCLEMPEHDSSLPLQDISFVDDMALPILCSADTLLEHIADVCGIVYLVFRMYGMELNFAPGKSAVVLKIQGAGKKSAEAALFNAKKFIRINKLPDGFSKIFINVVDSYKHLGTQISLKVCPTKLRLGVA